MNLTVKKPSSWVPIAMSVVAIALILGYVAIFGVNKRPNADEGAPARLFQLLMFSQLFVISYFIATNFPKKPKETAIIFLLQILAAASAVGLIFFLEL